MAVGSHHYDDQQERISRSITLAVAVSLAFLVLIMRLVQVQVIQAEENIRLSAENRMQLHMLAAPRGLILDRNGEVLARNRPSYAICVLPYKLRDRKQVMANLCAITDSTGTPIFDSDDLTQMLIQAHYRRFDATRLKEDVSLDLMSVIEEHSMDLPGIVVETEARREYTLGPSAFHILGYVGEIPETQFDSLKEQGYLYGDLTGRAGIERQYESLMRGQCGEEYVEVNAYGKRMGTLDNMPHHPPVPGSDLVLTVDARLQRTAEDAFPDSLCGAVVVLDPRNGDVLAMVSKPSVDPNIFSMATSLRSKSWQAVAADSTRPLNNRAITGTYAPGSTFKLATALAGLASGKIHPSTLMPRPCTGAYRIGTLVKHCWALAGHGYLGLEQAIQKSCDIYFYQLGILVGDSTINTYARALGLGAKTGIDLPNEVDGWLSGEAAFNARHADRGWKWTEGLVCDHAIGQTQNVTPIQLACMVSMLGNRGVLYRPHLLKQMRSHDGSVLYEAEPETLRVTTLDSAVVGPILEGMRLALEEGGTAGRARVEGVVVGGKTGSAEWKKGELTHALFVGVAPLAAPEIAIAVVLENAGHGGSVAAPIAGAVFRCYFNEVAPRDSTRTRGPNLASAAPGTQRPKRAVQ